MKQMNMRRANLYLLLVLLMGCSTDQTRKKLTVHEFLDSAPIITPQLINEFDSVDSVYFGRLGFFSAVLDNGDIVLPSGGSDSGVIIITSEGELKKVVRKGRGPQEIINVAGGSKDSSGNVYLRDDRNNKVVIWNNLGEYIREFIPQPYSGASVIGAYPLGDALVLQQFSFTFLTDNPNERRPFILTNYVEDTKENSRPFFLKGSANVRKFVDGDVVLEDYIPSGNNTLTAFNADEETIFIFDTATEVIAEINASYDTLRTIQVQLPRQEYSEEYKERIKANLPDDVWSLVSSALPKYKSVARGMMYHDDMIWLSLGITSDYNQWAILNRTGDTKCIVNLPKGSSLTHVSNQHLGVRINATTFGLYKPISCN